MHLNLNSTIAARQNCCVNDLELLRHREHNKIKSDKYKMTLDQQHAQCEGGKGHY